MFLLKIGMTMRASDVMFAFISQEALVNLALRAARMAARGGVGRAAVLKYCQSYAEDKDWVGPCTDLCLLSI